MAESRLEYLFNCYVENKFTEREEEELMTLLAQPGNELAVQKLIDIQIENTGSEIQMTDQTTTDMLQKILQAGKSNIHSIKPKKTFFGKWWRLVAVLILFLAGGTYVIFNKNDDAGLKVLPLTKTQPRILPGKNQAWLTTADGKVITLDSLRNGTLTIQGNTRINKQGGLLIYNVSNPAEPGLPIVYNTLSTPRGGQYQVVLPDRSKVWLNSASSLHFPTAFKEKLRVVELTGEAYFEVTKNNNKPFLVKVRDMEVKVLGTHFNINAYPDESTIKTSILEGRVKITKGKAIGLVNSGEQALLSNKESKMKIIDRNMDEVVAWKNGLFQFDGADITTIMREIGRWYNVEIEYADKVPVRQFEGKISRNAELSDVLRILELSNVKFTLVGSKIIVE
ncbi:MAG: FecR family protein [Ginsengibacter sp.]